MEQALVNLEVFGATLLELARQDSDLLVVTSDSRGSAKLAPFAKAAPGQIVEVGIAEQNLVGVASGLAAGEPLPGLAETCFGAKAVPSTHPSCRDFRQKASKSAPACLAFQ